MIYKVQLIWGIMNIMFYYYNIYNNIIFSFSIILWLLAIHYYRNNIIFMLRIFTLGIVGYLPNIVKYINSDALFSYFLIESQTIDIVHTMLYFTNLAIVSSMFGLYFGIKLKVNKNNYIEFTSKKMFYAIFILLIITASLISLKNPIILFGVYAKDGLKLPLHNLNTIANVLLFILITLYFKYSQYNLINQKQKIHFKFIIFFSIIYLLIFAELIRGMRMDFLNGVIGTIILINYFKNKNFKIKFKYIIYGILLVILLQIIGLVRSVIGIYGFEKAIENIQIFFSTLISNKEVIYNNANIVLLNQGTINNIAATFSGIIYMIKNNIINIICGKGYLEYILRIPPEFLYPDRPISYAWIFKNNSMESGGGIFELGMAYLNFGILGIILVPFIISFVISYSYKIFINNYFSIYHSIVFLSIIAVFFRGMWYQTFTFFKAIITGFILVFIYYIVCALFNNLKIKIIRIGSNEIIGSR